MAFAENLKHLTDFYELSNYRLAKELDCSQTSVANWLDGVTVPHKKMRAKIASLFGISEEELMSDKIPHIKGENKLPTWPGKTKKPAPNNGDGMEKELIQLFRLLPDDLKAGIIAQLKAVLTQRGLLPEQ